MLEVYTPWERHPEELEHFIDSYLTPKFPNRDLAKVLENIWVHEGRHMKQHAGVKTPISSYKFPKAPTHLKDSYGLEPQEIEARLQQYADILRKFGKGMPKTQEELEDFSEYFPKDSYRKSTLFGFMGGNPYYGGKWQKKNPYYDTLEQFLEEGDLKDIPSDLRVKSISRGPLQEGINDGKKATINKIMY
jgi:hypothetical protein